MRNFFGILVGFCAAATAATVAAPQNSAATASANQSMAAPTFARDVAPIVFNKCASCHRPGEVAPMPLLSYRDVRPWATAIRQKVSSRQMPPWDADPHYGKFRNDLSLTDREIDMLVRWVDAGAREGDPSALPPLPKFPEGWEI